MRIWTQVSETVRAINRLADSIRSLATAIAELARVERMNRR